MPCDINRVYVRPDYKIRTRSGELLSVRMKIWLYEFGSDNGPLPEGKAIFGWPIIRRSKLPGEPKKQSLRNLMYQVRFQSQFVLLFTETVEDDDADFWLLTAQLQSSSKTKKTMYRKKL